jgi:membrane protease YdiL (CAAX protease family)
MALGTLLVFGGLGFFFIPYVRETSVFQYILGFKKLWLQVAVGLVFGIITARAGWQIVELPKLFKIKVFFSQIIKPLNLTTTEIIIISLCAGIGEEMFFRGVLQPVMGIWATSILFVLLHGYLNPFNLPLTYYGIYMVFVIGVIGLFTENFGIITAMVAHAAIDYILLQELSKVELPTNNSDSE